MKVWVYDDGNAGTGIYLFKQRIHDDLGYNFLGTLDLNIKPEKKWVTVKDTDLNLTNIVNNEDMLIAKTIPKRSRNITLQYEVEE